MVFGATGDLAYKKIYPALYALAKRGLLDMPVIGVSGSDWSDEQLRQRASDSIAASGAADDKAALKRMLSQLHYVSGDYNKPETFDKLKTALAGSERPAHYLAIPPSLFEVVIKGLGAAGLAQQARVIVEKPFGRDLASARKLNAVARKVFAEDAIFRIDHFLAKEAIMNLLYFASRTVFWNRSGTAITSTACRSRCPNNSAPRAAAAFTKAPAACAT